MAKIGNNEIFLRDSGGDKPAMLLVHGIMMDHTVWDRQFDAFSEGFRVVAPDLRGYGKSTTQSPDISFEDHARDLASLIDALGLRNVTYVGWSMGGAIGQVFAPVFGDKIDRLVMVDTSPQLVADDAFPHAIPVEAAQQLGAALVQDFASGCAAFCGMIAPESTEVAAKLSAIAAATSPDVALSAFHSSGARNQIAELAGINIPTWVIAGSQDAVCLPAANAFLAEHVPGCTSDVTLIDQAGAALS
jgi:pimeloyl-ACP methyl ester carboxylesterase